jgi:Arc/MetJ-type ribon-helix-helix transcriptional regulator
MKKDKKEMFVSLKLTEQLNNDLDSFCKSRNIRNKSELIRIAIRNYIEPDVRDETLLLVGVKDMQIKLQKIIDMLQTIFSFLFSMHKNNLAYHSDIPENLKSEAAASASKRFDSFYNAFQKNLRSDPSFFERILHQYYSGDNNG